MKINSKIYIYTCLSKLRRTKWENIEICDTQMTNFAFVPVFLHTQEVKESLVTLKMYVTTQMYIHQTN